MFSSGSGLLRRDRLSVEARYSCGPTSALPAEACARMLPRAVYSKIKSKRSDNISESGETNMRTLLITAVLAIAAAAGGAPNAAAADPDPVVGTWQLNVSKSTFTAGQALKSQTRTYSQSGRSITLDMKTVGPDGKESTTHTTYRFNGKDFPVAGNPDYDSLSPKRVSNHTAAFTLKKDGKAVGTTSRTVSKDGATLTSKTKITTATGEKSENVLVFDKQ